MKAIDRINIRESQQLYKKVGNRYEKASDLCAYEGLREGWWLIHVQKGCTSIRTIVNPAHAEVEAAIRAKQEEILPIIREACEARPQTKEISPELKADWEALVAKHGDALRYLTYESMQGIADKIVEGVMK